MDRPNCPGHKGKCKFCGEEFGRFKYVGSFKVVDRITGEPIIDFCCKTCKKNYQYARKKFDIEVAAKLGTRIPRGDEV